MCTENKACNAKVLVYVVCLMPLFSLIFRLLSLTDFCLTNSPFLVHDCARALRSYLGLHTREAQGPE